ncbi:hypothetical protein ACFU6I_41275 [Streptomyces sp. NPDC057486]|uniref:hypothetical protein n=1 Tax=Streptomyces sp. NPDC057486 TaxID=3346145 RepID=UPI0036CEA178
MAEPIRVGVFGTSPDGSQCLTDVHCPAAPFRLHDLWVRFDAQSRPDHAGTTRAVLADGRYLTDLFSH